MIEIGDTIVSDELFTTRFCCDLAVCRGECCVQGNSGAPLNIDEIDSMESEFDNYKEYMKPEGVAAIQTQGVAVLDDDGDLTTTLINGAECAYSIMENGVTWCAIEKAWSLGKTTYRKPISCHLYPIRLVKLGNGTTGLQYHRWDICRAAQTLGASSGKPLYMTLREPLIRQFGIQYYEALNQVYEQYFK